MILQAFMLNQKIKHKEDSELHLIQRIRYYKKINETMKRQNV